MYLAAEGLRNLGALHTDVFSSRGPPFFDGELYRFGVSLEASVKVWVFQKPRSLGVVFSLVFSKEWGNGSL